jgi:putative Holliday junction resolvase
LESNEPSQNEHLPTRGRLAGIDFGTVRIGVSICDPGQQFASPLENYTRRNEKLDGEFFQKLFSEEQIVGVVIGLPIHLSGDESQKSAEARQWGKWLQEVTGLPIEYFDERFTSVMAEDFLLAADLTKKKRKARMDKVAAQILLSTYLESNRTETKKPQSLDD